MKGVNEFISKIEIGIRGYMFWELHTLIADVVQLLARLVLHKGREKKTVYRKG